MTSIELLRLAPGADLSGNAFGYDTMSQFDSAGKIYVPFITWKKRDKPDEGDIKQSKGYFNLSKPQMLRFNITGDDRLKIEGEIFVIVEVLPIAGGVYYKVSIKNFIDDTSEATYSDA